MSKTVEWINWPIFVEEGGGVRQATTAEVLREFNKTINEIADLRTLLAQREGELEALRGKVRAVYELVTLFDYTAVYDLKSDILAALSDNPESPALTDKEEGE